jgi:hypothetical protein
MMATKIKRFYEDLSKLINQPLEDDGEMYNVGVQIWAGHS